MRVSSNFLVEVAVDKLYVEMGKESRVDLPNKCVLIVHFTFFFNHDYFMLPTRKDKLFELKVTARIEKK